MHFLPLSLRVRNTPASHVLWNIFHDRQVVVTCERQQQLFSLVVEDITPVCSENSDIGTSPPPYSPSPRECIGVHQHV